MKLFAIAWNTFRETIRDKIMIGVLLFATLIIVSSIATVQFTVGQWMRLTTDVGLGAIAVIGIAISIFLGISLVSKEIERKTVYTIVSKPVRRSQFVLGKYLGLLLTLFVNTVLMLAVLLATLAFVSRNEANPYLGIVQAWIMMMFEFALVTAIAVFFSTFSTPTLSAMFTAALWIIGHLVSDMRYWALKSQDELTRTLVDVVYYILPNLEILNVRNRVTYFIEIRWSEVLWTASYAAMYTAFILAAAVIVFSKRDFK